MTSLAEEFRPSIDYDSLGDDYTLEELREAVYKALEDFVGQEEIVDKVKEFVLEKDPKECPNLYFRGMNGVGKTTLMELLARYAAIDPRHIMRLNSAAEGLVGTIRGIVNETAKYGTIEEGERVIWFKEAWLMSAKAIEALKEMIEQYPSVKWFFDSNRKMDIGLDRRCSTYDFDPITQKVIYERLMYIREVKKLKHIPIERLEDISVKVRGNLAEGINMLLTPPTKSVTSELFSTAGLDYDLAYESYMRSRPNPMDFFEEASVFVASSSKLDFSMKKTIIRQAAIHYNWYNNGVPDTVVMGSMLTFIHEETQELIKRKPELLGEKERDMDDQEEQQMDWENWQDESEMS